MDNADYAIKFTEKTGLPVFPVRVQSSGGFAAKAPHIAAPFDNATTDPAQIRKWFHDFRCAFAAHPGRKGFAVVDLDLHGNKNGKEALSQWEFDTGNFIEPTMTVSTPSGGCHLWFRDTSLTGGKDGLLDGVDVHGGPGTGGRYVLLPGQTIAAGSYVVTRPMKPAPLPAAIADMVNAARATAPKTSQTALSDCAPAGSLDVASVLDEIAAMKPIEQGGRDNTFIAMCLDWKERGFTPSAFVSFLRIMRDLGKFDNSDGEYDGDESFNRVANSAWKKASAVFGSNSLSAILPNRDKYVTAAELMTMKLPEPEWLIDKLLPAGALGFIGGNAKSGKTFLCLQLALCVASGTPFLRVPAAKKRNVLYIYLEGNMAQVQKRYRDLYGGSVHFPDNLHFIFGFPVLDAGGISQLKDAIAEKHIDLVILDTWQKARIDDGSKGLNAYQKEYRELTKLGQEICTATGCSFMLVHHLKQLNGKNGDIDALNQLNGSAALAGASDFIFILNRDRGADTAKLHCHGRDLEDQDIPLVKGETMLWKRSENGGGLLLLVPETETQRQIVEALQGAPDGLTAREVTARVPGAVYNTVSVQLNRWHKDALIDKVGKKFRLFEGHEGNESDGFPDEN